jgi:hypothetical protein
MISDARRRFKDPRARAALWHPLLCLVPLTVAFAAVALRPGSVMEDFDPLWRYFPLPAAVSFMLTVFMEMRRGASKGDHILVLVLGLLAGAATLVAGLFIWAYAAKYACHGRYECPF